MLLLLLRLLPAILLLLLRWRLKTVVLLLTDVVIGRRLARLCKLPCCHWYQLLRRGCILTASLMPLLLLLRWRLKTVLLLLTIVLLGRRFLDLLPWSQLLRRGCIAIASLMLLLLRLLPAILLLLLLRWRLKTVLLLLTDVVIGRRLAMLCKLSWCH
jgi:hypothetical protein